MLDKHYHILDSKGKTKDIVLVVPTASYKECALTLTWFCNKGHVHTNGDDHTGCLVHFGWPCDGSYYKQPILITPESLADVKMICEKATPGPWRLWNGYGPTHSGMMAVERIGPEGGGLGLRGAEGRDILGMRADLEFVAHARFLLPLLVAEVERLQAVLLKQEISDG